MANFVPCGNLQSTHSCILSRSLALRVWRRMALAVLSTGMPPSAALATSYQAWVVARRVCAGLASSYPVWARDSRAFATFSNHSSLVRAAASATNGFSASAIRNPGTTAAVRRGQFANERETLVLGIETSCDDTGAAVVSADGRILGEAIASQAELLARWGGVVPNLAQEEHEKFIDKVVSDALQIAGVQESDLSAIAVTIGPGLSLCLRVGVRKARKLARTHQLPLLGVHHMEAHALVVRITEKAVQFPFVVLLISGGHNLLLLAKNVGDYVQLGTTIDDAIGEAYDKTARLLGLDLKRGGGPALEEIAHEGNPEAIPLSVPLRGIKYKDCNFSYAGLKTQVRMAIEARNIDADKVPLLAATSEDRQLRADIAASFQRVAVQHLEDKCRRAIEWARKLEPSVTSIVVSGGVASNQEVRRKLSDLAKDMGLQLVCPPPRLCTDNGVMVAWAGIEHLRLGVYEEPPSIDEPDDVYLDLRPRWQLGEIFAEGLSQSRSMKKAGNHPSLTAQVRTILGERRNAVL